MNVCSVCGYKQVKNSVFELHMGTHVVDPVKVGLEDSDPPKGTGLPEVVAEPVVPVPEVVAEPVQMVDNEEITIRFSKPVEIQINGVHYDGKEVKVKNMSIAAEIVRIARTAYGPGILA